MESVWDAFTQEELLITILEGFSGNSRERRDLLDEALNKIESWDLLPAEEDLIRRGIVALEAIHERLYRPADPEEMALPLTAAEIRHVRKVLAKHD